LVVVGHRFAPGEVKLSYQEELAAMLDPDMIFFDKLTHSQVPPLPPRGGGFSLHFRFVAAFGDGHADIEGMRAKIHLVAGNLEHAVVVLSQQPGA